MPTTAISAPSFDRPRRVGRCELFGSIARGGMATVYLGRWIGEGAFRKVVAVKALHPELAGDPEFRAMFLDEARVVARIRHPNVLPTVDLVEEGGELFIVMEFLEGATLAALVNEARARGESVPPAILKRILGGVLQGLHAAHEARDERGELLGVIHRDVAPDNIMVGTDGYARIIDFGIARAAGRSTQTRTGMIKGKIAYLSPEQLLEEELTRRTDVYGASVVGWQLASGRRLFEGDSAADLAMKIVSQPIPPPSVHGGDPDLDAIIMRGLERDPADRWESAEAMAEAIDAAGGLASHREVGAWVRRLAREKLADHARLVERIESHVVSAPIPLRKMTRSPSTPEALEPITPPGEPVSRTDVTSEADAREASSSSRLHHALIAAIVASSVAGTLLLRDLALPTSAPVPSTIVITAAPPPEPAPPLPAGSLGPAAEPPPQAEPPPAAERVDSPETGLAVPPPETAASPAPAKALPPPAPAWKGPPLPPRQSQPNRRESKPRFPSDI